MTQILIISDVMPPINFLGAALISEYIFPTDKHSSIMRDTSKSAYLAPTDNLAKVVAKLIKSKHQNTENNSFASMHIPIDHGIKAFSTEALR